MISMHLTGGLGNTMFILARGESWGMQGYDIVYANMDNWFNKLVSGFFVHSKNGVEYKKIFKNFNWDTRKGAYGLSFNPKRLPFKYIDITPQEGNEYIGYFQSEKNFYSRQFIEWLFEPSDEVKQTLEKYKNILQGETCSIHVRRGDYIKSQVFHPLLGMDYYNASMGLFDGIEKYLVFSDDICWCESNFKGSQFYIVKEKDYIDMFLQSMCTHHIIANSSFSWWGAWLNEKPETRVIAPKIWFGNQLSEKDIADLIPERWVRI